MAGDKPMLSAFAARKAMLAKTIESKGSNALENGNGGSVAAETAQEAQGLTEEVAPAGTSAREKRMSGRRKRQRVEVAAAAVGEGDQKATVAPGAKPETKVGRQSKNKRATADESSQLPAEVLTAPSIAAEMDLDDGSRAARCSPPELQAPGAISGTPIRNAKTAAAPATPSRGPLSAPFTSSVSRDIIEDSITWKANGVVELRIDQDERLRLPVVGQYGVRVVRGEVSIAGATLRPSSEITWIHSSLSYSAPVLRCPDTSILELHPHPTSGGLRGLGRLSPLFRGIWNRTEPEDGIDAPTYRILCGPEDLPKRSVFRPLYSAPEWNKKLAELTDTIKSAPVFICGPKGSGKSTFGRLLTNRLLTQAQNAPQRKAGSSEGGVIVLDLDPGQPEFSPAGTISLVLVRKPNISPPFAHPWPEDSATTLIRCHALASVTPGSDTDFYVECALDLYRQYQRSWNGYPLVVNTPGWILGTGLDLLGLLIGSIRPGKVVYMSEDGPMETVEGLQSACKRTSSFETLPSQQSGSGAGKTAAQLRAMQTMSYFHSQGKAGTGQLSWDSSPLSTVPPWRVVYSGMNRGFAGVMCYGGQPDPSLLAEAINGMVLAAVEIEDEKAFRRTEPEEDSSMEVIEANDTSMEVDASKGIHDFVEGLIRRTPEGIPYFEQGEGDTLDPLYSRTIGLVLVRGVDVENTALQVITPIPRSTLEEIRQNGRQVVLVHGQFDAPTWAYTEDLYEKEIRDAGDEENEDESGEDESGASAPGAGVNRPWVEGVDETRRRRVGGGTWRVRRDLGKQNR